MSKNPQLIGIISKPKQPELSHIFGRLAEWLKAHKFQVVVDKETAEQVTGFDVVARQEIADRKPTFVIVLGGDGTLLSAARAVAKAGVPILGVNLGSLGFLTEVALSEMYPTLEGIYENRCGIEKRSMLHCQLQRGGKCCAEYEALNDVVTGKSAIARTADFELSVNGAFVSNYKADGLIVATPTGSTAYSLASGGPILSPKARAFVITPVSPHALTHRPLVLPDDADIEIFIKGKEETYLTVDGQVGMPLVEGDRVHCSKSKHEVQLYRLGTKTSFDVLRQKLKWGER
jgi:NAD+ kinase